MIALRLEDVQLAGRELVGDDAGRRWTIARLDRRHDHVEHVVLVEEVDAELDAVLEQRLQDHVAGAVGRVAGAAHGRLAVVAGVAAEAALVDLALGRAVERQAHVLEVEDRVDGLLREDLGRVLVDQVVAALDRVEGVPLPVVLLHVGERGGHAALRRAGVGAGGVELRDDRGAGVRARLDRRAHPGAAGADDDDVVLVVVDAVDDRARPGPRRSESRLGLVLGSRRRAVARARRALEGVLESLDAPCRRREVRGHGRWRGTGRR